MTNAMTAAPQETPDPILEIKDLKTGISISPRGMSAPIDGVSLHDSAGPETLGVVGESGCGKSITARSILRISGAADKDISGQILYHRRDRRGNEAAVPKAAQDDVVDLLQLKATGKQIRRIRGAEISMIFQEPMTAFSPVHTIGNQIIEAIRLHHKVSAAEARAEASRDPATG